jgi:hypothetical protein
MMKIIKKVTVIATMMELNYGLKYLMKDIMFLSRFKTKTN